MCASFTNSRVICLTWITLILFASVASAQVSEMSESEQRRRLYQAHQECNRIMATQPVLLTGLYCNRTWDNVMCWPDTPAGVLGYQSCPVHINGFDQAEYATKHCLENGSWLTDPESGKPWTNFSSCFGEKAKSTLPKLIVDYLPGVKLMATIGYSLSLAALILAVIIMVYFRRLHCQRNIIHLNMFVAFLGRAAFALLKNIFLVQDLGFPNDVNDTGRRIEFITEGTHWECKLFFSLFNYILLASLMWLFNEGLYLVLILSVSVFSDKTRIWWFTLLGWGFPVVVVITWVICRIKFDDILCWNLHVKKELFWILRGPMVASVAVNFIFFVNIIRILFTKLTASNCPESKKVRYRKLAKSTLILIPLFAVYHMVFIWLPDHLNPTAELFKIYCEMLFNCFQGFLVALLFCFLNAEVQNEIRKKWQQSVNGRRESWRSQPSVGSILGRSVNNDSGYHRNLHNGSGLDSEVTHPLGLQAIGTTKTDGHLSAISEEAAPLNGINTEKRVVTSGKKHYTISSNPVYDDVTKNCDDAVSNGSSIHVYLNINDSSTITIV